MMAWPLTPKSELGVASPSKVWKLYN